MRIATKRAGGPGDAGDRSPALQIIKNGVEGPFSQSGGVPEAYTPATLFATQPTNRNAVAVIEPRRPAQRF